MITPLPPDRLVLESRRLRLAPLTRADEDIARALLTDPEVMRHVAEPMTPEAVTGHLGDATRRGAGGRIGIWCATRRDTGEKIGDGILLPLPIEAEDTDWREVVPHAYPSGHVEIGYLLVPSAWGRGFATEICARLLRFAFEETDLAEIVAVTDPENARSQRVLAKCGLSPLGRRRAYAHDDVAWFAVTRDAWRAAAFPG